MKTFKSVADASKNKKAIIFFIFIAAVLLRVIACFWGYPLRLHPDEPVIVNNAISMLSRHSYMANMYNRPDQFEIKCNAVIFEIISRIKYHMSAGMAFDAHKTFFYVVARLYTAAFGAGLVLLACVFLGRMFGDKGKVRTAAQLSAAVIIGFSYIFVQHSGYSTPDIVLTFFLLLFSYGVMRYMEEERKRWLFFCIFVTGISISIKYPAAIMCIFIAFMVIYTAVREKRYADIVLYGAVSIFLILLIFFAIAPNLILNLSKTLAAIKNEARNNHLGADGLSFWGNLMFYFKTAVNDLGYISLLPFCIGIIYVLKNRNIKYTALSVGLVFWICMSVLHLHWLRWGIPMFLFYDILVSIGIGVCAGYAAYMAEKGISPIGRTLRVLALAAGGIIFVNTVLSGLCMAKFIFIPDSRLIALEYLNENGINEENSIYGGYSPLNPNGAKMDSAELELTENGIRTRLRGCAKQWYVTSDDMKNRFMAESERYADMVKLYERLDKNFERIYRLECTANYQKSPSAICNIIYSVGYILTPIEDLGYTGSGISVYSLKPEFVTLRQQDGEEKYLSPVAEGDSFGAALSDYPSKWVLYETNEGGTALVSAEADMAMGEESGKIVMLDTSDENCGIWNIAEKDGVCTIVAENGKTALTSEGDGVVLRENQNSLPQHWIISPAAQ